MKKKYQYDLIVIGGGSAGLTAATISSRLGAKTLLIDKENLGGDCLHYGCVPSKALLTSSNLIHHIKMAKKYGLESAEATYNINDIMERIRRIKGAIGKHDSVQQYEKMGVEVKFGGASFVDNNTILVDKNKNVSGKFIIICTGSHAIDPKIPGLKETGSINHVSLFHLETFPVRLAVLGGGPIGCEMGQAFARLGSKVTIIQRRPCLLNREDSDISLKLQKIFEQEGIKLLLSANPINVKKVNNCKQIDVKTDKGNVALECDEILVAGGRKPNIKDLNLEAAGIKYNEKGIILDNYLQTSQKNIFAAGDCTGGPQFTHWAEYEARKAVRNALFIGKKKYLPKILPWVTFTDPEVARVGLTLKEAEKTTSKAKKIHEHCIGYEKVDRAVCEDEATGLIKVVVDNNENILGVHIIGPSAGEALSEWVLAMENKIRISRIGQAIHVYPTLARINRRLTDELFFDHGISEWMTRIFARFSPVKKK